MRMSLLHCPTLKEAPKEAEIPSHQLMIRGGYIRKAAAGIYSFLPLAVRTIQKISRIIQEELNRAGAQEVLLPTIQPAELWQQSGRWEQYGPELLRVVDRKEGEFCYAPTAEEVIVAMVSRDITSYRQLPVNLYQIGTKFRDEIRPRAGLMRGREFIMKDAYSFHVDDACAQKTYDDMYDAYHRIFKRCGLAFRSVEADTGSIGGSRSHEFQVLAETGEDSIVSCPNCNYTANVEKAEIQANHTPEAFSAQGSAPRIALDTPDTTTVEGVAKFLKIEPCHIVKTLLFIADEKPVAALIRGDLELNEMKLKSALGATELQMADAATVWKLTEAPTGFAGPVELSKKGIQLIADHSIAQLKDFVCGANAADKHYTGVNFPRDFPLDNTVDLRTAQHKDPCGRCGCEFNFFRGIEVGHVFFLGTKYSQAMKCHYRDANGEEHPMVMGCYGIGVTRILAAAIEQNHDEWGIQWPLPLAPYEVVVMPLGKGGDEITETAEQLYQELLSVGVEAVIDDRDLRPGVKFKDADLLGFPYQVVIGKKSLQEGKIELKDRTTGDKSSLSLDEAVKTIQHLVSERKT